jgi:hypothetical protein
MTRLLKRIAFGAALMVPMTIMTMTLANAQALTPSCQAELDKHGNARLEVIQKINKFNKKNTTAKQACSTFQSLVSAEAEMLKWMEANQDWCRLPPAFVTNFKEDTKQGVKARTQVCTAARKQAQRPRAPRGPAIGGGVALPKGAL